MGPILSGDMPPSDPPQSPEVELTLDAVNAVNAGYVAELYEQFRRDPASVDGVYRIERQLDLG